MSHLIWVTALATAKNKKQNDFLEFASTFWISIQWRNNSPIHQVTSVPNAWYSERIKELCNIPSNIQSIKSCILFTVNSLMPLVCRVCEPWLLRQRKCTRDFFFKLMALMTDQQIIILLCDAVNWTLPYKASCHLRRLLTVPPIGLNYSRFNFTRSEFRLFHNP